jgi:hypothetical protein
VCFKPPRHSCFLHLGSLSYSSESVALQTNAQSALVVQGTEQGASAADHDRHGWRPAAVQPDVDVRQSHSKCGVMCDVAGGASQSPPNHMNCRMAAKVSFRHSMGAQSHHVSATHTAMAATLPTTLAAKHIFWPSACNTELGNRRNQAAVMQDNGREDTGACQPCHGSAGAPSLSDEERAQGLDATPLAVAAAGGGTSALLRAAQGLAEALRATLCRHVAEEDDQTAAPSSKLKREYAESGFGTGRPNTAPGPEQELLSTESGSLGESSDRSEKAIEDEFGDSVKARHSAQPGGCGNLPDHEQRQCPIQSAPVDTKGELSERPKSQWTKQAYRPVVVYPRAVRRLLPAATVARLLDNSDEFSVVMEYEQVVGPEGSPESGCGGSSGPEDELRTGTGSGPESMGVALQGRNEGGVCHAGVDPVSAQRPARTIPAHAHRPQTCAESVSPGGKVGGEREVGRRGAHSSGLRRCEDDLLEPACESLARYDCQEVRTFLQRPKNCLIS